MNRDFRSTKSRVAQVIYVTGGLVGVVFVGIALLTALDSLSSQGRLTEDATFGIVASLLLGAVAYGAGWAGRWIIDGTSTSVFDRWIGR